MYQIDPGLARRRRGAELSRQLHGKKPRPLLSEPSIESNDESILLEEAICNAVVSLLEDNDMYLHGEEKEEQQKKSSPMHKSPASENARRYLNIESNFLKPITTYMIAEYIQAGQDAQSYHCEF